MTTAATALQDIDLAAGEETWRRLITAVAAIGSAIGPISQTIALLHAKGKLTPAVSEAYVAWMQSADGVLKDLANIIEQNPNLRAAIDAAGTPPQALQGLRGMLGNVVRPSDEVIALLKAPLPIMGPRALAGLDQVQIAQGIARFSGAAWKKLLELLSNRGVVTVGSVAVAADTVRDVVGTDIDLEAQRAKLVQELQNKLVASGIDPDEAYNQALRIMGMTKTGTSAPIYWLVGGAAGLGLLLFWLRRQGVTVVVPDRGGR